MLIPFILKAQEINIEEIPLDYFKVKALILLSSTPDNKTNKIDTLMIYHYDSLYRIIKTVEFYFEEKYVNEYKYDGQGTKILKSINIDTGMVTKGVTRCGRGTFVAKKYTIVRDEHARIVKEEFVDFKGKFICNIFNKPFYSPFKKWSYHYYYIPDTGLIKLVIDKLRKRKIIFEYVY
jgi:hypothetical protein